MSTGPGGSVAGATSGRGNGRIAVVVLVVVGALIAIGQLTADRRTNIPYDPTSTSPSGTRAVVDVLREFDAKVDVPNRFPNNDIDIAVMFRDVVPPSEIDKIKRWVEDGHTLVITDPTSELTPEANATASPHQSGSDTEIEQGKCNVDALRGVRVLDEGASSRFGSRFVDNGRVPVCFSDGETAFVVVTTMGGGRIVSIASGAPFQNRFLTRQDNAALAVSLLAPTPGTRVGVITRDAFAGIDGGPAVDVGESLSHVLTPGLNLMILQLAVALAVYGVARGRRLGRPVAEPQPVQIAASELVGAVGNLMQQMKQPDNAAGVLRRDVRAELGRRLGLPPNAPPLLLADTIAARTGLDRELALAALDDHPISSEAALVSLAQNIDAIREEVLHGHAP